jgi:transcriptional regulator with XRE-family HTH domain
MDKFERVLGRVIAQKRKDAGISQEALAFRCKLHPTYISQLERGLKSPTVRVLRLIAEALGTPASALLHAAENAQDPVLEH